MKVIREVKGKVTKKVTNKVNMEGQEKGSREK